MACPLNAKEDVRAAAAYVAEAVTNDDVILVDASGGAVTITLPAAATAKKELCIKKIDTSGFVVTIDGSGSETIDDSTTLLLATPYDAVRIISDGTEWWIL